MSKVSQLTGDTERLRASLTQSPLPVPRPVIVVLSGLPGSGKSYFGRRLVERFPLLVLQSDFLRRVLFSNPTYAGSESERLFDACYGLIEDLLRRGIPLLLDATNLVEHHRDRMYRMADRCGAKLILVYVKVPDQLIYKRLASRSLGMDPENRSEADWGVYQKMHATMQAVSGKDFEVDTSVDISPTIDKVVREIGRWTRGHV